MSKCKNCDEKGQCTGRCAADDKKKKKKKKKSAHPKKKD
jgi:radical SAM protein with 4Fe4S-binding SPASM domain